MKKTLVELNEELLLFLYQKHSENPDFLFRTRTKNQKVQLSKGYWFITHNTERLQLITTSFWSGNDKSTSKPHIRVNLLPQSDIVSFDFNFEYSKDLKELFKNLANKLDMKPSANPNIAWTKEKKVTDDNYLDCIDDFIKKDKVLIDNAIEAALKNNKNLENLELIKKDDFNKWINNINKYQRFSICE